MIFLFLVLFTWNSAIGNSVPDYRSKQNTIYLEKKLPVPVNSSIQGTFRYNNTNQTPIDSAWVYLYQGAVKLDSCLTDIYGSYTFNNVANGAYTIRASSNQPWRGVDVNDVNLIHQHFAELQLITEPVNLLAGDVNGSNSVNGTDAELVRLRLGNYISGFTIGNWVFAKPVTGGNSVNVSGNINNLDFYGLFSGDVNGSATFRPLVITTPVSGVTTTGGTSGGTVVSSGGTPVTAKGICWSSSPNPDLSSSHSTDGSGTGTFTHILSGLIPNTTYYIRAYATNSAGTKYGNQVILTLTPTYSPCPGFPTVTYGGQTYNTIQIGTQCWFKENLNIGNLVTSINTGSNHSDVANNGVIEKYCFDNDPANCSIYGGLYDWNEMMQYSATEGTQGICPSGWHIPTDAEWCTLTTYLDATVICSTWGYSGTNAGGKLKESGTTHWYTPNTGATNESGFTGLAAGNRIISGSFDNLTYGSNFWSSSEYSTTNGINRYLNYNFASLSRYYNYKTCGFPVRCIKGCGNPTAANAGPDQLTLTSAVTFLAGNTPASDETGLWAIVSGIGGNICNISNPTSSFNGIVGNSYTLSWTITNPCGNSSVDQVVIDMSNLPGPPCIGTPTINYNGHTYNTVQIGTQCWMRENLDVGTMVQLTSDQTNNGIIEKYCYNNDPLNCCAYGGLYQWDEMMQYVTTQSGQGICPSGWHLPTDGEFTVLNNLLGGLSTAGGAMKETGLNHWISPNTGATNTSGFSALGAGYRQYTVVFGGLKINADFWSSTQDGPDGCIGAWHPELLWNQLQANRFSYTKTCGYSVRCIKTCPAVTSANAGPDQLNLACLTTNLSANSPGAGESGQWSVTSGSGGNFANNSNPTTDFTGASGVTYVITWTLSNACGNTTADQVSISFANPPGIACPGLPTVTYGSQIYNTIQIGSQCWLRENLNIGSMIPATSNPANNGVIEKYCYNNNPSNCLIYGGLYQWQEMMQYSSTPGVQGICPSGWHVPTDADWCTLLFFLDPTVICTNTGWLGTDAGGKLKETCTTHWQTPNTGATNISGFTGLPGGFRSSNNGGSFWELNTNAHFWSSSEFAMGNAYKRILAYNNQNILRDHTTYEVDGYSVRCIQGCLPITQANAGPDQINVSGTSTALNGNLPASGETGIWTITSGTGGSLANPGSYNSGFTGLPGSIYFLKWTLLNACNSTSYDDVVVAFAYPPEPENPCPGLPTLSYGGKVYHTVQVGTQCWLRENLDIGVKLVGGQTQTDNGVFEKNCYFDEDAYCDIFGGLYSWYEIMNYSYIPGGKGICPSGWHIPTDTEWSILEGSVDSVYGVGSIIWDPGGWRGTNVAARLKSSYGWTNGNGNNASRFRALPGGVNSVVGELGNSAHFWSSNTESSTGSAIVRVFNSGSLSSKDYGSQPIRHSARCIKDTCQTTSQANAGPDQLNVPGNSTVLNANSPGTNENGIWNYIGPYGGSFSDIHNKNAVFTGTAEQTYLLRWTLYGSCSNITHDSVVINFAFPPAISNPCPGMPTVTYLGKVYHTAQIGDQCWLRENLNPGLRIKLGQSPSDNGIIEKFCNYNEPAYCEIYGGLYPWNELMNYSSAPGAQGICPAGWHVPADEDWKILEGTVDTQYPVGDLIWDGYNCRGSDVGTKLKSNFGWINTNGTNTSGFTALPAGIGNGSGDGTLLWASSGYDNNGWRAYRGFSGADCSSRVFASPQSGLSARCLKNMCDTTTQANAGPDLLNLPGNTVTLNANQPGTGETGTWYILFGEGGSFSDLHAHNATFTGFPEAIYLLRWTINGPCSNITHDSVVVSFLIPYEPATPCTGIPTVTYAGNTYHTVQIGYQCWLKENLFPGTRITLGTLPSDNGILEKYCLFNEPAFCEVYGGLYDWFEMMNYNYSIGGQGICPTGWHVPTDTEWMILEGTVDSQFGVGDVIWESSGWRGFDAGTMLKASHGWTTGAGTNTSGFTVLPSMGYEASLWSSGGADGNGYPIQRKYSNTWILSNKGYTSPQAGLSVRCIKNGCNFTSQADAGPDQLNIPGNSTTLNAVAPGPGESGTWNILDGPGASLSDVHNKNAVFTGLAETTYLLRWSVYGPCSSITNDLVVISFAFPQAVSIPCPGLTTVSYGGKVYHTVQIGSQCWFRENLNIGSKINFGQYASDNAIIEKYCSFNEDSYCEIYGGMYGWDEMMNYNGTIGSQGICPSGWHVPTDAEWKILEGTVDTQYGVGDPIWNNDGMRGSDAGTKLKANFGWFGNLDGTNTSGFTAISDGISGGGSASFWTGDNSVRRYFDGGSRSGRGWSEQKLFVRCLKNNCNPVSQANAGPDQIYLPGNTATLSGNSPASGETGTWTVFDGPGGVFSDIHNPNAVFTGQAQATYLLRWTFSDNCYNSTYDQVVISFAISPPCSGLGTVSYGGKTYHTLEIGTQCWLKENLDIGTMITSTYTGSWHSDCADNGIIEKYCYNNDPALCDVYGGFYDWDEMMQYDDNPGIQGICPSGWHIPTDTEYCTLFYFLDASINCSMMNNWIGTNAGGKMKETGLTHWNPPNSGATNESGFTALGTGRRNCDGDFVNLNLYDYFWTSTELTSTNSIDNSLSWGGMKISHENNSKTQGFSIRCIKN